MGKLSGYDAVECQKAQDWIDTKSPEKIGETGLDAMAKIRTHYRLTIRELFECVPVSRERSEALTLLQTSCMWAIKGIAMNGANVE